jgi:hypothetical protein
MADRQHFVTSVFIYFKKAFFAPTYQDQLEERILVDEDETPVSSQYLHFVFFAWYSLLVPTAAPTELT